MTLAQSTKGSYVPVDIVVRDSESGRDYEPYSKHYSNDHSLTPRRGQTYWSWRRIFLVCGAILTLFLFYGAGLLTMFFLKKSVGNDNTQINAEPIDLKTQKLHSFNDSNSTRFTNSSTQTTSPPPLILPFRQGTNQDNKYIGPAKPGASLLGTDYVAALLKEDMQPDLPVRTDGCTFEHVSQLGMDGSTAFGVSRNSEERPIERSDVIQGNIGNCGFGAGLLALIGNGNHLEISQALYQFNRLFWVRFRAPTTAVLIKGSPPTRYYETRSLYIDDKLAMIKPGSAKNCPTHIGFYPSFGSTRNFYVPLLEKAWAKYTDAYPDNRAYKIEDVGYKGLTGTPANKFMQAMTGLDGHVQWRTIKGFDLQFAAAILRCVVYRMPCVVSTGFANMTDIGNVDKEGYLRNEAGDMGMGADGFTFTVMERKVPRKVVTFVNTHYYAIDNEQTALIDNTKAESVHDWEVVLRNPWNCNPIVSSQGLCESGKDGELKVRMSTLFYAMIGVEWVQST